MSLQFTIDRNGDPDRRKLRAILEAQFAYERMSAARSLFVHLLAVAGVVLWLEIVWPNWFSADFRFFTLTIWGGLLFLTIGAAIEEVLSRRRLKRYIAAQKGVTLNNSEEFS